MRFCSKLVLRRGLVAALLLGATSLAMAQYIWIDDKGIKQLSDRPPPPSVPYKNILKAPGKPMFNPNAPAEEEAAPAAASASASASAAAHPKTLAERDADFTKRRADAAEANKKASEEAQQKAAAAANCDATRRNQMSLDAGVRLSTFDKDGNRSVMGDEERAELAKKNQRILAGCK